MFITYRLNFIQDTFSSLPCQSHFVSYGYNITHRGLTFTINGSSVIPVKAAAWQ